MIGGRGVVLIGIICFSAFPSYADELKQEPVVKGLEAVTDASACKYGAIAQS